MPTLSGILSSAVERLLFHPVTITDVEVVGKSFRLLRMQGVGFQGVKWIPGQSVQIFLGNFIKRAYTPMSLDSDAGSADFLVYLHGKGPGSECEDGSHLADVISQMAEQAVRMQSPQWVFTGQARSIQRVQKGLKQAGVPLSGSKVKAYWSPGKTGMD